MFLINIGNIQKGKLCFSFNLQFDLQVWHTIVDEYIAVTALVQAHKPSLEVPLTYPSSKLPWSLSGSQNQNLSQLRMGECEVQPAQDTSFFFFFKLSITIWKMFWTLGEAGVLRENMHTHAQGGTCKLHTGRTQLEFELGHSHCGKSANLYTTVQPLPAICLMWKNYIVHQFNFD